jgi:hypothetical protein
MTVTRIPILFFVVVALLLTGCAARRSRFPVTDVGRKMIILGGLLRPVGQEVTIHGHKMSEAHHNGPLEAGSFFVDAVDGEKLDHPVVLRVRGIHEWRGDTEATIRGYEVGTLRFEHIEDANYGPDDPRFTPHQVMWMHFEPQAVTQPKSLKIGDEKWSFD